MLPSEVVSVVAVVPVVPVLSAESRLVLIVAAIIVAWLAAVGVDQDAGVGKTPERTSVPHKGYTVAPDAVAPRVVVSPLIASLNGGKG